MTKKENIFQVSQTIILIENLLENEEYLWVEWWSFMLLKKSTLIENLPNKKEISLAYYQIIRKYIWEEWYNIKSSIDLHFQCSQQIFCKLHTNHVQSFVDQLLTSSSAISAISVTQTMSESKSVHLWLWNAKQNLRASNVIVNFITTYYLNPNLLLLIINCQNEIK